MRIAVDLQACQFNGRYRGIGRYSLNLVEHMLDAAGAHEFVVCLSDTADVRSTRALIDRLSQRMPRENIRVWSSIPGIASVTTTESAAIRRHHACLLRDAYLASLRADVIHTASLFEGFGDDTAVRIASDEGLAPRTAVTHYDLIPYLRSAEYLRDPHLERWYRERLADVRNAGMLLAISEASRSEAVEHLGISEDNIAMISSGVDPIFSPWQRTAAEVSALRRRFGLSEQFVMYTGGFDSRKNLHKLVQAWASIPKAADSQLVFVGMGSEAELQALRAIAVSEGLADEALRFLGYVSDEDLIRLYSITSLFAFPSVHEGFGLPILEAMACGAPVIAADATSLPEVVGLRDALFDPASVASIGDKLNQALNVAGFADRLRAHAVGQSRQFTWDRSAKLALSALEELGSRQKPPTWRVNRIEHSVSVDPDRFEKIVLAAPDVPTAISEQLGLGDIAVIVESDDTRGLASTTWVVDAARTATRATPQESMYLEHGYGFVRIQTGEAEHAPERATVQLLCEDPDRFGAGPVPEPQVRSSCRGEDVPHLAAFQNDGDPDFGPQVLEFALESARSGPRALLGRLVDRVASASVEKQAEGHDLEAFASAAARNHPDGGRKRQLLLDVSELVHQDQATGIQRVVRRVLSALMEWRDPDIRVEPVYFAADGRYRYAADFTARFLGLAAPLRGDDLIDYACGDVFLGLDLAQQCVVRSADWFERMRNAGVQVHFVIYDLLPWIRSEFFHPDARYNFESWLQALSSVADGVICISRAVADEFIAQLDALTLSVRRASMKVGYFHLGADLGADVTRRASTPAERKVAALIPKGLPMVLMVSTLEPRKGYQQALDAFDLLWHEDDDMTLVIVGKLGWMYEHFAQRLRNHPQWQRRLFWFEGASDGMLQALYRDATVLLSASEGEGFGLPLIEAAQSGVPLLCRDLPVFREVAGPHAVYFRGESGRDLATAMRGWLVTWREGHTPASSGVDWQTWDASTQQLLDVVIGGNWYAEWRQGNRHVLPAFSTRFGTQVGVLRGGRMGTTGDAGLLLYGPYLSLSAGHYRFSIQGHVRSASSRSAWAALVHAGGAQEVSRFDLADTIDAGVVLDVPFDLDDDVVDLEVHVWAGEGDIITITSIDIAKSVGDRAPVVDILENRVRDIQAA